MRLTEDLIRKKSEHNEGIIGDLEEISLHQCELERIEVIGTLCRKIKILYLQNNVIPKIEGLNHLKDLQYVNLALNNITKIEGLRNCEFLNKLDLTVNFIDIDTFEESIDHLRPLEHFREIYLMGNPCTEWEGHRAYIIHRLPQVKHIDGKDVTRADRIRAAQEFKVLRENLRQLAAKKREEKGLPKAPIRYEDDKCEWSPEVRLEMAREMEEQKRQQEESKEHMKVKKRDHEKEQAEAIERQRRREEEGDVKQCNEGRWDFALSDEDGKGNLTLSIPVPRFLDTSLIDVDVHPTWVTIIIKGKTFRIKFPEEISVDRGKCERSKTTGELLLTLPKVKGKRAGPTVAMKTGDKKLPKDKGRVRRLDGGSSKSLSDELLEASKAVSIKGIAKSAPKEDFVIAESKKEAESKPAAYKGVEPSPGFVDDPDVPPP